MQFEKGQSGNRTGRPRGSRNRMAALMQELFEEDAEAIARKAIELAMRRARPQTSPRWWMSTCRRWRPRASRSAWPSWKRRQANRLATPALDRRHHRMIRRMRQLPVKRLQALEQILRPYRFLWTRREATRAEIEAERDRMIAAGRASAHDRFVIFSWNDSGLY
jgi:Family of unknown function (DUF5681)